jgi:signal recognition particle subunit SRP54
MFEVLSERLGEVFRRLAGKGRLSEKDIEEGLRQVRMALLEADVNLKVVKEFSARVKERCLQAQVLEHLSPAQQVVKIVHEELLGLLGERAPLTPAPHPPSVVMLVGLQGSGKTTTAAKLVLHLRRQGQRPLLVPLDPRRPAAREQLMVLGRQLNIPVLEDQAPLKALPDLALERARGLGVGWVIADTAGRLHIDQELMTELREMRDGLGPSEVLLVVDAMTGQDGVRVAEEFHRGVGLTGAILTKMDGDARGGVALSVRSVTGVPIKFLGTGEKTDALEPFYPDRLASRILGMGDVLTLIEKAQEAWDEKKAQEVEKKLKKGELDLEDLVEQLEQLQKMGPVSQVLGMIPGMGALASRLPQGQEDRLKRMKAIIQSMTPQERRDPQIIDGNRRRRIARGSGTTPQEVNQLLNQFRQMQKLVRQMGRGKGLLSMLKGGP